MNDNQSMMLERSMRSVFVGNIPFDLTEEKLKEIFSAVGPVMSFKLVYDRENGKPKGYGFCEYVDVETANSAMRNLNGHEIAGRTLKVDNAANEKTRMELQMATGGAPDSMMEPVLENSFEHLDPDKVPEAISKVVASLPPEQMFDLMKQMKQCIQNNPHEARTMLLQSPQLAYGLLQSLVVMKIVDPEIALTMLSKPNSIPDLMNPESRSFQPPPIRQEFMGQQQQQQANHNVSPHINSMPPQINQNLPPMMVQNMPPHINQNMPPQLNQNMPPQMNQNMPPQMNQNMPPQMNQNMPPLMNQNMPHHMNHMNQNMPPHINHMNPNVAPPQMGNSDIDTRPMDPRNRMIAGAQTSAMPGGTGDVDLRTQMPLPVPAPVMPPLPNASLSDQNLRDPRQPPLPSQPPRDPRASDPRSGGPSVQPPLPRQPPPLSKPKGAPAASSGQMMPNMAGVMGDAVSDQEKAQLIMQVLQLTNEQIAMLPAEQRQSILLLKEQIAKSKQR